MTQPTKKELQLLLEYLSEAEDLVISSHKEVEKETRKAVNDIVTLCLLYGVKIKDFTYSKLPQKAQDKLKAILAYYRQSVYDRIKASSLMAIAVSNALNEELAMTKKDMVDVEEFINQSYDNKTLKDRIYITTDRMSKEWEAFIAIGLISTSPTAQSIVNKIWANRQAPFAALPKVGEAALSAVRLSKEFHPGTGFAKSGLQQLRKMEDMAILGIYHESNYRAWLANGAIGFRTITTSANPCQVCVDSQYVTHKDNPLPWHVNCRCISYGVFNNKEGRL